MLTTAPAQTGTDFQTGQEMHSMNKTVFEGKWKQIRAQSKEWWSLINDLDLSRVDKAAVKFDKYVVLLQVKYGYARQKAKDEIGRCVTEYEANSKRGAVPTPGK
jgi:hypothetical protein